MGPQQRVRGGENRTAVTVGLAEPADLSAWQDFVDANPEAGPLHHAGWYRVLCDAYSVRPYFFIARDDGNIAGVLPAYFSKSRITGKHLSSLEGGILAESDNAAQALYAEAIAVRDRLAAQYLLLRGGRIVSPGVRVPTVHTILDTRRDPSDLWSAIKGKTRWGIRHAEQQELEVEIDAPLEKISDFYKIYAEHMRDLGTPVFGFSTFRAMCRYLGPKLLRLYLIRYAGRLIGGMLCIKHASSWTDWLAIVRISKEIEFANYLLYWTAIKDASACGALFFDLGRSTPDSNVHLFKRKWGGTDVSVDYHVYGQSEMALPRLLADRQTKTVAQRVWSRTPLLLCNIVGPIVRRELPFI